jgi:short-subunit dehydrogenase
MKPQDMKVLLTGASGGIGTRLATILADSGAQLLLTGRDSARLSLQKDCLAGEGRMVETFAADISTAEGIRSLASAATDFCGGINVLVNNAGINDFGRFDDQSRDSLNSMVVTNILAPINLTHELLPSLQRQREALIVNIGSILGSIGVPGQVAYSSTKFALHGFSEALRRELGSGPVRVVYVAPRSTETEMNDALQREVNQAMGVASDDPGSVAVQIADAISSKRTERFLGWPERLFVKLNALFPGIVDRSLQRQATMLGTSKPDDQALALTDGVQR